MPSQLPYIILTAVVIVLNARPLIWQFKQGNSGPIAMVKSESPKRSASSECPAHAYEIGKDVGFSRGIKVIVEEELEVIV
ncbi:hypothetical protein JCM3774_002536 [Rhodotorula dairenensis]